MRVVLWIGSLLLAVIGALAVGPGLAGMLGVTLPFQTETIDRSQPALLVSVQELSQYHAAVGSFEVVLDIEEDTSWVPGFIAGERSLFVAAGTVNAYVDLSGLSDGDLQLSKDETSVTIRLPEAQLDEPNLDQERTYLFSQDRGVVDRIEDAISTDDQSDLYQRAEEKLATAAAESDLTHQAEENTEAMLVGMFNSLDLEVTFVD
jgi:hypothetical protein